MRRRQGLSGTGETATLSGEVVDDGLPEGNALNVSWTQVFGPGVTTFGDVGSAATVVDFERLPILRPWRPKSSFAREPRPGVGARGQSAAWQRRTLTRGSLARLQRLRGRE